MRKVLLLLAALLPALSFAGNMAISKTSTHTTNASSNRVETRAYVSTAMLGGGTQGVVADSYAIGAWIKVTSIPAVSGLSNRMVVFGHGGREHCNDNGQWNLCINTDGNLVFTGWGGVGGVITAKPTVGEWQHLLVSYNNNADDPRLTVYLNGENVGSAPCTKGQLTWFTDENPALYFAAWQFNSHLDEAQIYNHALTDEQVKSVYTNAALVDGLVGLYTFDEIAEGTTGQFANKSPQACAYSENMTFETGTGTSCWDNGVVYIVSTGGAAESAPTLVEGRELAAALVEVTVSAEEGGSVSFTIEGDETVYEAGTHEIAVGSKLNLVGTPEEGYELIGFFNEAGELVANPYTVAAQDNVITAKFTSNFATLTVAESNATYTLSLNGETVTDFTKLLQGAPYTLTVDVPNDYVLTSVTFGGEELTANADGTYTLTFTGDAELVIATAPKAKYTVAYEQTEGATLTVSANGVEVAAGSQVLDGTVLAVSAAPAAGYKVVAVKANGVVLTSETYTVTADVTFSVEVEEGVEYCTLEGNATRTTGNTRGLTSLAVSDNEGNSVTVSGTGTAINHALYTDQTATVLTTKAGATLSFVPAGISNWMMHYLYIDFNRNGVFDVDQSLTTINGDLISHSGYNLTMKPDGTDTADPSTRSDGTSINFNNVMGEGNIPSYTLPVDMAPGTYRIRYKLDWNSTNPCGRTADNLYGGQKSNLIAPNGGVIVDFTLVIESDELEAPRTVAVVSANQDLGTVAIVNPATEEASVSTTQKSVQVQATPAEGCAFINWTNAEGEVLSTEAEFTYKGEEDVELTANFGIILNCTAGEGGIVSISVDGSAVAPGAVVALGSNVEITLIPSEGKRAKAVTLNGEPLQLSGTTCSFTVEGPVNVVAVFGEMTYDLTITIEGPGQAWVSEEDGDYDGEGTKFNTGDTLEKGTWYNLYVKPGKLSDGTYAEITTLVIDVDDVNYNDDPALTDDEDEDSEGNPVYVYGFDGGKTDISIVFTDNTAAIGDIIFAEEEGVAEYFNLQGVRVAAENLNNGIYIVRKGNKTAKILIRK